MLNGKTFCCVIPARGGSSLKDKNVRLVAGQPLIVWSIQAAKDAGIFDRIVVSTDSETIAKVAMAAGAEVQMRPPELATSDSPISETMKYVCAYLGQTYDYVQLKEPTSPLVDGEDIQDAANWLLGTEADFVISVCESNVPLGLAQPVPEDKWLRAWVPTWLRRKNRQEVTQAYQLDGNIYMGRWDIWAEGKDYWDSNIRAFIMPPEQHCHVDTELDFEVAEYRLRKRQETQLNDVLAEITRQPTDLSITKEQMDYFDGKTVLVTGAAGSIGSELCRFLAQLPLKKLVMLDHAETPLFNLSREIPSGKPVLTSILNLEEMDAVFGQYRPEIVLHAAAYKHVPLSESNSTSVRHNNIVGTKVLCRRAYRYGTEKFLLISTDKAVDPCCVMGQSKKECEQLVLREQYDALMTPTTQFMAVRFGNVLDSAGSVLQIFRDQMRAGVSLTLTHPDMTRYFMSIREAVYLILSAATFGKHGNCFVLDMGEPVKLTYLAEQVIRAHGKVPYRDVQLEFTGLRPGERLEEHLTATDERLVDTLNPKIKLVEKVS